MVDQEADLARVLLLQPPLLLHQAFIDYPYFASLGLWQAAAVLQRAGHEVTLLDALALPTSNLVKESNGLIRMGVSLGVFLARLPEVQPEVVVLGNSAWLRARPATQELAKLVQGLQAKWPAVPVILADCDIGGMHFIDWDERDLAEIGVAWGVKYESDQALVTMVAELASGRTPPQRVALGVPSAAELDDLPLPAYDLVNMEHFQRFLERCGQARQKQEIFSLYPRLMAIKTSRGCVFQCNFCTSNAWQRAGLEGKSYRRYGKDALLAHATLLRDRFGIRRLVVLDELVNVHAGHFDDLLDVAEALDLELDFPNGMRADRLTEVQVGRLKQRTSVLSISAESAVERVANDLIGKKFDLQATERVAQWCKEHGLRLVVHWMIGQPQETKKEILTTLQTAWHLYATYQAEPLLQFATPIRGTQLYETASKSGAWEFKEDRDIGPLFQGKPVLNGPDWTRDELWAAKRVFETRLAMHKPRKVILNTTYICNNHCVFCATGNRSDWHGETEKQIGFLRERRQQGYDLCDFDGGEPTTNPDLFKLIRAAKELGYQAINLTTNGRMMALQRNAEKVVRSGITSLLVSLHGPNQDVHERNVQAEGAFAQTVAGIENAVRLCAELGVEFGVNVTLTTINTPVLLEYGDLLLRLGVRQCNVQFLTPFGRASAECQPDPAEAARQTMRLIDQYGDKIRFQVINLPLCFLPGYEEYGLSDIGKLQRHMVFVSMEDVNLFDYLQSRRRHESPCETCMMSIACEGFYYFPDQWHDQAHARFGD